jgi:hypothetical protein
MPFGLINFKIRVQNPGDPAILTAYLSQKANEGSIWYKYDCIEKVWQDFSNNAQLSSDGLSITLTLMDGGVGDADGLRNGIIVDPSGLGSALTSNPAGGGSAGGSSTSGSCFISTVTGRQDPSAQQSGQCRIESIITFMLLTVLTLCIPAFRKRQP